jgi:hypothetical protein
MAIISKGRHPAIPVPIESGEYFQLGESSEKKTKQVVVNFEITDGVDKGRKIAWIGYFTEKTVNNTLKALRVCGLTGDDLSSDQPLTNPVSLVVDHEDDQEGKPRARVSWVNAPGGGGGLVLDKTMSKDDRLLFAASLKSRLAGIAEVKSTESTPAPVTSNGAPRAGSDIKL